MTAQVRVAARPWADQIAVYLMRDVAGQRLISRTSPTGTVLTEMTEPGTEPEPSLVLDDDTAVALLDALAAHYRRATDTGTLRADYEHARRRVDVLTDSLLAAFHTVTKTESARVDMLTREVTR